FNSNQAFGIASMVPWSQREASQKEVLDRVAKLVKDKSASEDDQKRAEADIQKVTDKHIVDIDKLIASKEQEIMAV
ncbi:MAG: ribosome recycling factor, partial [Betaproteobacteria bacterium]|nr:ribosome recycling factor [Betaproteobacteria bacterium]